MSRSAGRVVIRRFRQRAAHRRDARAQHIHRMGGGRNRFQRLTHHPRQAAQATELGAVGGQFGRGGQMPVDQQMRHFLIVAGRSQIENVIAAIMQVIAALAHRAKCGIACRDARKRHGFLRFSDVTAHLVLQSKMPCGRDAPSFSASTAKLSCPRSPALRSVSPSATLRKRCCSDALNTPSERVRNLLT